MTSFVLAGGGTAGHISPMVATAEALKRLNPDAAITCVGTPKGMESRVVPAAGLTLKLVPAVPMPRTLTLDLATMPPRLGYAVARAMSLLRKEKASVVTGFGGYASLPVYLAARLLRIPVVVHEQNAIPGLANRVGARFAKQICVSFPNTGLRHQRFVGLPVRRAIVDLNRTAAQPEARRSFGLPEQGPVILVSGGSQGAARLNSAVEGALSEALDRGVSILHVLGPKNMTAATMSRTDVGSGAVYAPVAYVDGMERAYAAADLMVGRSGAGTVVETAIVGLPALFVPLPHGNGEQAKNATSLVEAGGAILIPDKEMSAQRFLETAIPLATNPARLAAMAEAGTGITPRDAATDLAEIIVNEVRP